MLKLILVLILLLASIPSVYLSISSAALLQQYEASTKRAAKLSREAGRQLRKTRTTQTTAVLASLSSFLSALYCCIISGQATAADQFRALCIVNAVFCLAGWRYVGDFWAGAMKVPGSGLVGAGQYNDAVRSTQTVLQLLKVLGMGWGMVAIGKVVGII